MSPCEDINQGPYIVLGDSYTMSACDGTQSHQIMTLILWPHIVTIIEPAVGKSTFLCAPIVD